MKNRELVFHRAAAQELDEAQRWYRDRCETAGIAFALEVDLAVRCVTEAPERWPLAADRTRRFIFPKFPFTLVYRVSYHFIQVVAVAHQSRRPGYWRRRRF